MKEALLEDKFITVTEINGIGVAAKGEEII